MGKIRGYMEEQLGVDISGKRNNTRPQGTHVLDVLKGQQGTQSVKQSEQEGEVRSWGGAGGRGGGGDHERPVGPQG